jgi:hypothetical protein
MLSIAKVYGISRYDDGDQMEEIMQFALQHEIADTIPDSQWDTLARLVVNLL